MKQSLHEKPRTEPESEEETLHLFLPYNGKEAESIVKRAKKRLTRLFKKEKKVRFSISFQSTKVSFYTSNKDKIPLLSNSGIIYKYTCPGCKRKTCSSIEPKSTDGGRKTAQYISTSPPVSLGKTSSRCFKWMDNRLTECNSR